MATVIKASQAGPAAFHPDELGQRAQSYLDQVRAQAAELLSAAEGEAAELRQRAHDEGYAAGMVAAQQTIDQRVAALSARLEPLVERVVDSVGAARAQWLAHWETSAVRVATSIAGRVIRREVSRTPQITLTLVRETLELAGGCADIQLRLNPDDLALLRPQIESLVEELVRLGKPEIVADERLEPGGCRLETRFGSIDQTFTAQLDRIEQELS